MTLLARSAASPPKILSVLTTKSVKRGLSAIPARMISPRSNRLYNYLSVAPVGQAAQPAAAGKSPSPVGWIGQDKVGLKKATPSGSKCRVPAAPTTGPLKSPAPSR